MKRKLCYKKVSDTIYIIEVTNIHRDTHAFIFRALIAIITILVSWIVTWTCIYLRITNETNDKVHGVIFEQVSHDYNSEEEEYTSQIIFHTRDVDIVNKSTVANSDPSADKKDKDKNSKKMPSNDKELLERLAYAEAGNQDLDGIRRVVDVVLNRVDSDKFPNDILSVISQAGQFKSYSRKDFYTLIVPDVVKNAVEMETTGERLDKESLYFARSPITHTGLYQHGDHFFSR